MKYELNQLKENMVIDTLNRGKLKIILPVSTAWIGVSNEDGDFYILTLASVNRGTLYKKYMIKDHSSIADPAVFCTVEWQRAYTNYLTIIEEIKRLEQTGPKIKEGKFIKANINKCGLYDVADTLLHHMIHPEKNYKILYLPNILKYTLGETHVAITGAANEIELMYVAKKFSSHVSTIRDSVTTTRQVYALVTELLVGLDKIAEGRL